MTAGSARLAQLPLTGSESLDKLTSQLHTFIFSLHYRVFDLAPPELMLRVEMIVLAVLGIAFLSAAVYELAGPRPALIAAWVLALEPANVFFSSLLHKEPLMYLAEGLVVFGGAVLWKRGKLTALIPMVAGCLIAIATRPYVGWFLTAAAAAVVLHASLTRQRGLRSFALTSHLPDRSSSRFVPVVWEQSSSENLRDLQGSQDANARATMRTSRSSRSTTRRREKLIVNLPAADPRRDLASIPVADGRTRASSSGHWARWWCSRASRCWPWRSPATGGRSCPWRRRWSTPRCSCSLRTRISAGNAGTAFRYRTHLVGLALCLVIVLLAHQTPGAGGPREGARTSRPRPCQPD